MAKKDLKSRVTKGRKRPSGWHGNNRQLNNTERKRLGLAPLNTLDTKENKPVRQKGTPNLKRVDGNLINKHGVSFTEVDKKRLENEVNKANRKRIKMLESEGKLPRISGGENTGQTVKTLQAMGKESDFIITRKSKSLQQFKNRESFENYLKNLEYVNSPTYIDDRTRQYKRNHMKALENAFGDEAKDVIMKIRMMKPEEYRKLLQSDENMEISYIYEPTARTGRLNQIRDSLGMKNKDGYEELDDYD